MGRDKARLEVDGIPLIARQLGILRELAPDEIFIASRNADDYDDLRVPVLADACPGQGPLAGIERALATARNPLVLVLAVDLPRMTSGLLRALLSGCSAQRGVVPLREGGLEPLAAVYPRKAHGLAVALLHAGRNSARDFARECAQRAWVRRQALPAELAACLVNWNTPADVTPPV